MTISYLVAPTEPNRLKAIGRVHSLPEQKGVDVLVLGSKVGIVGIQRKEVGDLIASVGDGRLQRELPMMKSLDLSMLLVEGQMMWSREGLLLGTYTRFTKSQMRGLLWSVRSKGIWVERTDSLDDTVSSIKMFGVWLDKESHHSLDRRPNPVGSNWGVKSNEDWGCHMLQSFPGIGPVEAKRIYERYGVPFRWEIGVRELMSVHGIGKVKAERLIKALEGNEG